MSWHWQRDKTWCADRAFILSLTDPAVDHIGIEAMGQSDLWYTGFFGQTRFDNLAFELRRVTSLLNWSLADA